jgi:hypothetical protein
VRRVVVLHGAGVLANLLAPDDVGVGHLVPVSDPRFECQRFSCCSHGSFNSSI